MIERARSENGDPVEEMRRVRDRLSRKYKTVESLIAGTRTATLRDDCAPQARKRVAAHRRVPARRTEQHT